MRHLPLGTYRPRASVYVLQRLDRSRFKIGWALDPHARVRQLPEFEANLVDLRRSSVVWLPSRQRAEQVERSMQKSLSPYRSPPGHRGDGHSEWFDGIAHHIAVRLLGQIPVDASTGATGKLVPLDLPADFEEASSIGPGPLEVWWALEDLWLRTAQCRPVTAHGGDPSFRIVIHRCKSKCEPLADELRSPLTNVESYRWHQDGVIGHFVSLIQYDGDDLVCTLTSLRVIEGWPDGPDLACLVRAFLVRVREMTNAKGWR